MDCVLSWLPKRVHVEPGALEQAQVLAERNQHAQRNERQERRSGVWDGQVGAFGGLGFKTGG